MWKFGMKRFSSPVEWSLATNEKDIFSFSTVYGYCEVLQGLQTPHEPCFCL